MSSSTSSLQPDKNESEERSKSLFAEASLWNDERLLDCWISLELNLVKTLRKPCYSDSMVKNILFLLNRILQHKFDSLQQRAIRVICTDNFLAHVDKLATKLVGTNSLAETTDLRLVHDTCRRYAAKACETDAFRPTKPFSAIMRIIELAYAPVRENDTPSVVSCELEDFPELCRMVQSVPVHPSGYDRNLINSLISKTDFCSVPDYLIWLFQSLKIDFEFSCETDVEREPEIQAKIVVMVLKDRPHVSMGLEFEVRDFYRMIRCMNNGELMLGSMCFFKPKKGNRTIPVTIEKREVKHGDGIALPVSFDFDKPDCGLNSKHDIIFAREFYEPYRRVLLVLKRMAYEYVPLLSNLISPQSSHSDQQNGKLLHRRKPAPIVLNFKQNEAANMCLRNVSRPAIHLIQGPPGSGKTNVALEVLDVLLQNVNTWDPNNEYQILIISAKNETLDKILMSLLDEWRVLRLGGMSSHHELRRDYNFSALKHFNDFYTRYIQLYYDKKIALSCMMENVINAHDRLSQGILPLSDLEHILTLDKMTYFQKHSMKDWLFEFELHLVSGVRIKHVSSIMSSSQPDEIHKQTTSDKKCPAGFLSLRSLEVRIRREMNELKSMCYQKDAFEKIVALNSDINLHFNVKELLKFCALNPDRSSPLRKKKDDQSLASLNKYERWQMYSNWVNSLESNYSLEIKDMIRQNQEYETRLEELFQSGRAKIVKDRRFKVVGGTTCAAATNRLFLEKIKPKIVIVEEAAEVFEGHVVASLTEHTTKLILIGDHCQRCPQPASNIMPHMKVSLFERLINLGHQPVVLDEQYRMRPEISSLVSLISYPNLVDGPNVLQYSSVKGMKHNVFFQDCHGEEEMLGSTFSNNAEVESVIKLCYFLLAQGYDQKQLTVLSPYNAQVACIQKMLRGNTSTSDGSSEPIDSVRCCAVDGFQGEENDIIILSFVRSNASGMIGFLNDARRLTVALSRAKIGLYMVGNASVLGSSASVEWKKLFSYLEENQFIGSDIPVYCPRHGVEDSLSRLSKDEFTGFCTELCSEELTCGHTCTYPCHVLRDADHDSCYSCPVEEVFTCSEGHSYARACSAKCEVPVMKLLPCGHSLEVACGIEPEKAQCSTHIEIDFDCGDGVILECYEKDTAKCLVDCNRRVKGCMYNHKCPNTCHESCVEKCVVPRKRILQCGHGVIAPCCQDDRSLKCTAPCEKILPCGHHCRNICQTPCCCNEQVTFQCSFGHTVVALCGTSNANMCLSVCGRTLPECGHPCTAYCKDQCNPNSCSVKVLLELECGHEALVPCSLARSQSLSGGYGSFCEAPCHAALNCGHECKGTCGGCFVGRLHKPCLVPCGKSLTCHHTCSAVCSNLMHVCDNPSCLRREINEFEKTTKQECSQDKKVKRRSMNIFDVTKMINAHITEKRPDQPTGILADKWRSMVKGEVYPYIKYKLADVILGPLHEKAVRLSHSSFESNETTQFLLKQLFADFVLIFTNLPAVSIEKQKNLIFKVELFQWINHHLQLFSRKPEHALRIPLRSLMQAWRSQNYEFSWGQITQIFELTAAWSKTYGVKSPNFNFTRQYAVPLTEHETDWFAPQKFADVFKMLDIH